MRASDSPNAKMPPLADLSFVMAAEREVGVASDEGKRNDCSRGISAKVAPRDADPSLTDPDVASGFASGDLTDSVAMSGLASCKAGSADSRPLEATDLGRTARKDAVRVQKGVGREGAT
jgi:hypothetical protein